MGRRTGPLVVAAVGPPVCDHPGVTATPAVRLVPMPAAAMARLLADDLGGAGAVLGVALPEFFLRERWLWELRLPQVSGDPVAEARILRVAVLDDGEVVGHAGFHTLPDVDGLVEVGYTVVPERRGQGLGHRLLRALLDEADAADDVRTVRASVSPDNAASLAVVRAAGFTHVGEQLDDEDGPELVFERRSDRVTR